MGVDFYRVVAMAAATDYLSAENQRLVLGDEVVWEAESVYRGVPIQVSLTGTIVGDDKKKCTSDQLAVLPSPSYVPVGGHIEVAVSHDYQCLLNGSLRKKSE